MYIERIPNCLGFYLGEYRIIIMPHKLTKQEEQVEMRMN